jgi:hypothetical protein
MYEIATGEIPFENSRTVPVNSPIPRSATMLDIAMNEYRPTIPSYVDVRFAKLITQLWSTHPDHRPSAALAAATLCELLGLSPSHALPPSHQHQHQQQSLAKQTEARFADFA